MADVLVPTAPPLARINHVELMHTGTWPLSTGVFTFTTEDLYQAVAALDCPAVRRPILKLGHTDPRFDGEPAVGYIDNLAVADSGYTLIGDYAGMPGWLGDVIASAYPDRSIEGEYDFRCQMGHTHPFVLTGTALLGVMAPGIGTLDSLQDVGALYGVVNAARSPSQFTVHARVTGGSAMPNPQPRKVAATVTSEDVRHAFYEGAPWEVWIEQIQLDPLQLIVVNDNDGERSRVPIILDPAGDGSDAVTFAQPVPVVIRYEDVPAEDAKEPLDQLAASRITYASRAESRPTRQPAATDYANTAKCSTCNHAASMHADLPAGDNSGSCSATGCTCNAMTAKAAASPGLPAEPVEGNTPTPTQEVIVADASSTTLLDGLRSRLGVADAEADEATVLAALDEALKERAEPAEPEPVDDGKVLVTEDFLDELKIAAKAGAEARAVQLRGDRDDAIKAAVRAGKFSPARAALWTARWDKDPEGAKADIDELPAGLVPVAASGLPGGDTASDDEDANYSALFGDEQRQEAKV